jgi:tRNA(fMet)-specific endonuclease VapC
MAGPGFMLDTNIISALSRDPQGVAYQAMKARLPANICTSIIVAAEIEFGLQKAGSQRLRNQVEAILSAMDVLPMQAPAERHYGEIRNYLQQTGQPIGYNDLLIAAHARTLGYTLVTANVSEFLRVPDLIVENWLQVV